MDNTDKDHQNQSESNNSEDKIVNNDTNTGSEDIKSEDIKSEDKYKINIEFKNEEKKTSGIPTIIIEDDLTDNTKKYGRRKIFTRNNDNDEDKKIKYIDIGPMDPLSMLFASLITGMAQSSYDSNQIDLNPRDSNTGDSDTSDDEGKIPKNIPMVRSQLDYINPKNKSNNLNHNELNPKVERRDRSNTDLEEKLIKDGPLTKKQGVKVDFSSTIGDIAYLDSWLKQNLDSNNKFNGNSSDYTSDAIDHASSNGKINVLDWWKKVNKENDVPIKYSKKSINLASRNGKIKSLDWWLDSGYELKYDNDAIDYASNGCRIDVLNWWITNYKNKKIDFQYSNSAIDNCRLEEERLYKVVEWWKNQKETNNIEFKYTKEFITYLDSWSYTKVHKFLMDNSLIKPSEKIQSEPNAQSRNPVIGLFDLFGGAPIGIKRNRETVNNKIDIKNLPEDIQKHIREKEEELNNNMLVNGKAKEYIDNLVKIPFGKYKNENIFTFMGDLVNKINSLNKKHKNKIINDMNINNESDLIALFNKMEFNMEDEYKKYHDIYKKFIDIRVNYLEYVNNILDETIYGHFATKKQIKCIIAQWLSGGINKGVVLGIQGPPGVGKTTVIKGALSKCLVNFITYNLDRNEPFIKLNDENTDTRPFCFMSLGGTTNGSTLVGHNITYHGATSGDIVKNLKEAGIMNPILYFDELDKISNTEHGHEISSVLTHITDPVQNEHFTDRYFSEVKIDLSKCIIIFSYNDTSKIDRILLDRIQEIRLDPIRHTEKIEISKKFLIPEICKNLGYSVSDFIIHDDVLSSIILEYTHEAGVRKLKEKLQEVIRMKHLERLESKSVNTKTKVPSKFIQDTFADYPKMNYKKINKKPLVGYINGMYATTTGIGGVTVIQVKPIYHKDILGIQTTGSVEKVMSESIQVAKTVAYNLLIREQQIQLVEQFKDTGLHVHCPDGATPKDGPSAGTAITTAIYSVFINKPIKNTIAITGEIDLDGNVTKIGGLDAKLSGAKRAGVKLALVPKENQHDINVIKRKNPELISGDFKVKFVSEISEVIDIVFDKD